MKKTFLPILTAALLAGASHAPAQILISEINSNGTGGDFFEIYNAGSSAVDLGGWKWVDNAKVTDGGPSFNGARAYAFNAFTLNAGSSALVVSDASGDATGNTDFANSWGGLSGANLLTFNTGGASGNGLGKSDLVALFNSAGTFVTGLNYGTSAVTITQGDNSTVSLLPFLRAAGGTSAGTTRALLGEGLPPIRLFGTTGVPPPRILPTSLPLRWVLPGLLQMQLVPPPSAPQAWFPSPLRVPSSGWAQSPFLLSAA